MRHDLEHRSGAARSDRPLARTLAAVSGMTILLTAASAMAQGYGGPLAFHGLDRTALHSAGSRAMGGVTIGVGSDIGLMFQNPAVLPSLQGIQISFGAMRLTSNAAQEQNYAPVRYYPNLSVLLEGLTAQIPDPDPSRFGFSPQDSVQRPYDTIGPNWERTSDRSAPLQAMLAAPISSGKLKLAAGIGAVEYANLGHFYQNNNVLSPGILSQRPLPTLRPTGGTPAEVEWSQTMRLRDGSIQGYGLALAGRVERLNLSVAVSGMMLRGSSDDFFQQSGRGRLAFFSNAFRLDSLDRRTTETGTSEFSGQEFTVSSTLAGRYVSIGLALKLPMTIEREFRSELATDSAGTTTTSTNRGTDKLALPLRGTAGLSLSPRENLALGIEYEFRPYDSAEYLDAQGGDSRPWLSASVFRIGAEYMLAPGLALRAGMRGTAEIFQPEGNAIDGEPVTYTIYSAGIGVRFSGLTLNATYENSLMKYEDIWASAISRNSERRHAVLAQILFELRR